MTISTQQKYDEVLKAMTDKTLNQGCALKIYGNTDLWFLKEKYPEKSEYRGFEVAFDSLKKSLYITDTEIYERKDIEIIGHPLRIEDALSWMEENGELFFVPRLYSELRIMWEHKRQSLSPDDSNLVDYLYNLLSLPE